MADKNYNGINGADSARQYGWTGAKGERQAYAKAYADARAKEGDDTDYVKKVGEGGVEYDKARMSSDADAQTSKLARQHKIPSYKKGGKVQKTGLARLHKGERVIPTSKVHKVEKAMRKVSRKRG